MRRNQIAPDTRVRTFADSQGAYLCIAAAMPPSLTAGWSVLVEIELIRATGVACSMEPAPGCVMTSSDRRPTWRDLDRAIDMQVGDRLQDALETTELALQIHELLRVHAGMVGYLIRNQGLEVSETLRDASHLARELTMGTDDGERLVCASVLVGAACGAHPEPPPGWSTSPVGKIAAEVGLVELSHPNDDQGR